MRSAFPGKLTIDVCLREAAEAREQAMRRVSETYLLLGREFGEPWISRRRTLLSWLCGDA